MELPMKSRKHVRTKTISRQTLSSITVKTKKARKNYQMMDKNRKCICLPSSTIHVDFPTIWSELRNNMQLCDGIVRCEDNQEFKVHRAILSAVSPFFKALFLNTLNNGQPEETEVFVKVPGAYFSLILDFAYSGKCTVDCQNVQLLLAYADQLEVLGIVQLCSRYIIEHLNRQNCLEMLLFARQYFCRDLEKKVWRYIRHNIKEVLQENLDFFHLTVDEVYDILSDDELNVKNEEIVFYAVKLWVEFNRKERIQFLGRLLTCVRIILLEFNFFINILLKWDCIYESEVSLLNFIYTGRIICIICPLQQLFLCINHV